MCPVVGAGGYDCKRDLRKPSCGGARRGGAAMTCENTMPVPSGAGDARLCDPEKVVRSDFSLASRDGVSTLAGYIWQAPGERPVRAVVQLVHGMAEHILRYEPFARYLACRGYLVVGHDHIGHGGTAQGPSSWGLMEPGSGADHLIGDVHRTRNFVAAQHPGVPHFIFGHSMGSFILRNYLCAYGKGLAGAVVSATGWQPRTATAAGKLVCDIIGKARGWQHRSAFVHNLADGAYERAFAPEEGGKLGWLSRDPDQRAAYAKDPACGFTFSVAAYHELFELVARCQRRDRVSYMRSEVPVLLIAGGADPVGSNGAAIPKVAALMRACGVRDVREKLYPDARHELLNELNRDEVFADVLGWFEGWLSVR